MILRLRLSAQSAHTPDDEGTRIGTADERRRDGDTKGGGEARERFCADEAGANVALAANGRQCGAEHRLIKDLARRVQGGRKIARVELVDDIAKARHQQCSQQHGCQASSPHVCSAHVRRVSVRRPLSHPRANSDTQTHQVCGWWQMQHVRRPKTALAANPVCTGEDCTSPW